MNPQQSIIILLLLLGPAMPALSQTQALDRNIFIETVLDAPVPEVWNSFTTEEGLESFFAPECRIDLRVRGLLDIYFYPEAPAGQRGAEGMRIMSVERNRMFSFTWSNPRDFPEIQGQLTHVTLKFYPDGKRKDLTRLVLIHDGWGDGEIWDQAYQYYIRAWRDEILYRLHYRYDRGPVNWRNPPRKMLKYNIIVH